MIIEKIYIVGIIYIYRKNYMEKYIYRKNYIVEINIVNQFDN
jgi:hypothetical protein